jgi:hypothetical protein
VSGCFSLIISQLTPSNRCLAHVVNLANVAVMSHITKISALENSTAIWEYDPNLSDNRVLGGSLDVIASIRTIAIKVTLPTVTLLFISIHSPFIRFRHLVSVSSTSKSCKYNARFSSRSRSHFTATFDGVQHIVCSNDHISYASRSTYFSRPPTACMGPSPPFAHKDELPTGSDGMHFCCRTVTGTE